MAGLRLLPAEFWRLVACPPYLAADVFPGLCAVPAVRHLEALAGELGRPEHQGWVGRNDRRHDRGPDGGRAGGRGALFLPSLMFSAALLAQAKKLLADARAKGLRIATAESCTGGLIAGLLTEIPGSSDVVERGFVSYSNEAKQELLGVPENLIA